MAISISNLVEKRLAPALVLDTDLLTDIPTEIEAQIALQGWSDSTMTDAEKVLIAIYTIKALIPRLLLIYSAEIKRVKGGPAETEFQDIIDFLKELRKEVNEQIKQAQAEVSPEDIIDGWCTRPLVPYRAI